MARQPYYDFLSLGTHFRLILRKGGGTKNLNGHPGRSALSLVIGSLEYISRFWKQLEVEFVHAHQSPHQSRIVNSILRRNTREYSYACRSSDIVASHADICSLGSECNEKESGV